MGVFSDMDLALSEMIQLTSQQQADRDLAIWQSNRSLSPQERIELMFYDFILPPPIPVTADEYDRQMEAVSVALLEAA